MRRICQCRITVASMWWFVIAGKILQVKFLSSTPITKVNIYTVIDDKMSLSKIRRKIDVMADKHETINDYSEEMKFWIQHFYEKREVYKKCGITDDNGFSDLLSS